MAGSKSRNYRRSEHHGRLVVGRARTPTTHTRVRRRWVRPDRRHHLDHGGNGRRGKDVLDHASFEQYNRRDVDLHADVDHDNNNDDNRDDTDDRTVFDRCGDRTRQSELVDDGRELLERLQRVASPRRFRFASRGSARSRPAGRNPITGMRPAGSLRGQAAIIRE